MAKLASLSAQQHLVTVRSDGIAVGESTIDLLVERTILVELNAAKALDEIHRPQCLNDLKASGLHLCPLLNFGKPRHAIKRIVMARKGTAAVRVFRVFRGSIFLPPDVQDRAGRLPQ